ncbi:hypothetical protein [Streptomyces cyaneofuscatus]|uniref:hypothetical protein n=1 Tax=Streptomyces cyaneofuscatus TaxID=66883 RepID=UPI003418F83D
MSLIPPLLGAAVFLAGLALATDHRGAARWVVETFFNPAHADRGVMRTFQRLGAQHPGMDFYRNADRLRRFVRVWGGFICALGFLFLTMSVVFLVRD